jgi:hypothetical protein
MASICHSVVRAPAVRVTRLGPCGELPTSASNGCDFAVSHSFTEITLNKVLQERQDAFQLNANGESCADVPTPPFLRWFEVSVTFCNVDPELFNIVSAEPLILNDEASPKAVGWYTRPNSPAAANFALEFWVGTDDEGCSGTNTVYGYGWLPRIRQGMIGNISITNGVVTFTVTGITRGGNQWGEGPYNVLINETGPNAGFPANLLTAMATGDHKGFMWTELGPPPAACGCQDLTPTLVVLPLTGGVGVVRTATFPLVDGAAVLPAVINWGDASPLQTVTSGLNATHTYAAPGSYTVTYTPTGFSSPTYTSATVVVS